MVDSTGNARLMLSADSSDGTHNFVAMRKAIAALEFAKPSSRANDLAKTDKAMWPRITPSMLLDGGAVPLFANGRLIGALAASGAPGAVIGEQDEAVTGMSMNIVKRAISTSASGAALGTWRRYRRAESRIKTRP